ncbi:xanthine phosphoribosyltransferase [Clostridium sp. AWRP]|uniref:xanthine phosphoribosyltransferase n=1 Tax=Clostridium sp. AWRP TaxID=2212991 RepID=UPI000FD94CA8|nr:xanthine phosphoribosyltransferase [Clostridium sp. AWRP]AZV56501.1 xanthine phosphoribosyltransferase [Clostridium sp. AWRP]
MKELRKKILEEGHALSESILKVDSFLNHKVDPKLMYSIGKSFTEHFKDMGITKIFTIESSGIAPAVMTALQMDLPMVILKKKESKILSEDVYQTTVHSFTKDSNYELTLSKKYICHEDNILIIDDFLANGEASKGTIRLVEQCGAKVAGIGIVIEKSFQPGRKLLDKQGYHVYSLARIKRLAKDTIEFMD